MNRPRPRDGTKDVLVLCYHAISESWPAPLSVTPHSLERQLRLLVARGYRGATFTEAVLAPPAPRTLAVTFDDAYRSVLELGFPVLSELGLPGTVFVPTAFAGSEAPMAWPGIDHWLDGPHERELRPMSWDALRELAGSGWEIGSHTHTHAHLPQLDDVPLSQELSHSRRECEQRLGVPCRSLAYPYSDHDRRVAEASRAAGYEAAGILRGRPRRPDPLRWPRIGVYHTDDLARFRLKISPAVRRIRSIRAWIAR